MTSRAAHIKWIIPLTIFLVLLAVPSVTLGGARYSGADPQLIVRGHDINVWVLWPSEYTCTIRGPVKFRFDAPDAVFVSESNDSFTCDNGETTVVTTKSKVRQHDKGDMFMVSGVKMKASENFDVRVEVYVDGELAQTCNGSSNHLFRCPAIQLD